MTDIRSNMRLHITVLKLVKGAAKIIAKISIHEMSSNTQTTIGLDSKRELNNED